MAISLRRAKTVSRMVFEIMKIVAPASSSISTRPKIRIRRVISKRCSTTSCPYLADSTPSMRSMALAAVSTISGVLTVTSKESGSGFLSPSASKRYFWSPKRSDNRSLAASLSTNFTVSMPCIFSMSLCRSMRSLFFTSSCRYTLICTCDSSMDAMRFMLSTRIKNTPSTNSDTATVPIEAKDIQLLRRRERNTS